MRAIYVRFLVAGLMALVGFGSVNADFAKSIEGLEKKEGLFTIYVDHAKSRVLAALPAAGADGISGRYIYAGYLSGGLGSNPLGLDRSAPGAQYVVHFRRVGERVHLIAENTDFVANSNNASEVEAVKASFAKSIMWSSKLIGTEPETSRLLVDLTSLLVKDTVGVTATFARRGEGNYKIAKDRSFLETEQALAFPINMEFDATVTFAGSKPGRELRGTTPEPTSVTLMAHTTFLQLPDDGYKTRLYDDRMAMIGTTFVDMAQPLSGDVVQRYARRFRLEKGADGKTIKPIVWYVDNGAPEPVQSALVEGASWWADAFAEAGFPDGFRVEVLPEGVHPMDARYNVINWVHRATRGWSYGMTVSDPRTGEVLRGIVILGSLRLRQDIKIFEALAGAGKTGTGADDDPVELALDRVRQLSAHEVGHPIGFAHNMAASTQFGRASVMDYPAPKVSIASDGAMDFSETYAVGVGEWDKFSVKALYGDYGDQSDLDAQAALAREADKKGLVFVKDGDSRSVATANRIGAVWDNGEDLVKELENVLAVRRAGLDAFGEHNLKKGEGFYALQTKIVPLYLYHRYQLAAAVKSVGGMDFVYRRQGDGRANASHISWADQKVALDTVLSSVSISALDMSDEALATLSPGNWGGEGDPQFRREIFQGKAGPMFDLLNAAGVASKMTMDAVLHPARAQRLVMQGERVEGHVGLTGVMKIIEDQVMTLKGIKEGRHRQLAFVVQSAYVEKLIDLATDVQAGPEVRSEARLALKRNKDLALKLGSRSRQYGIALYDHISEALERAKTPVVKDPAVPTTPPGSPIGAETCWHCDIELER